MTPAEKRSLSIALVLFILAAGFFFAFRPTGALAVPAQAWDSVPGCLGYFETKGYPLNMQPGGGHMIYGEDSSTFVTDTAKGVSSYIYSGKRDLGAYYTIGYMNPSGDLKVDWNPTLERVDGVYTVVPHGSVPSDYPQVQAVIFAVNWTRYIKWRSPLPVAVYDDQRYFEVEGHKIYEPLRASEDKWPDSVGTRRFMKGHHTLGGGDEPIQNADHVYLNVADSRTAVAGYFMYYRDGNGHWNGVYKVASQARSISDAGSEVTYYGVLPQLTGELNPEFLSSGQYSTYAYMYSLGNIASLPTQIEYEAARMTFSGSQEEWRFAETMDCGAAHFESTTTAQAFYDTLVPRLGSTGVDDDGGTLDDNRTPESDQFQQIITDFGDDQRATTEAWAEDNLGWLSPWGWFYDPDELSTPYWGEGGGGGGGGAD